MTSVRDSHNPARPLNVAVLGLAAVPPALLDALAGAGAGGRFRLRALCDAERSAVDAQAAARGVPGYVDGRLMLSEAHRDGPLDAVFIGSVQEKVAEGLSLALERRLHVCSLPPVAVGFERAAQWVGRFAGAGLVLTEARPWRWHRTLSAPLRWRDRLGDLLLIEGRSLRRHADPLGWRRDWELAGGGAMLAAGRMLVDLTVLAAGLPDEVVAVTDRGAAANRGLPPGVEETALLLVRYDRGPSGTLTSSWAIGPAAEGFELHGSKATVQAAAGAARMLTPEGGRLAGCRAPADAWGQAWRATADNFADRVADSGPRKPEEAILADMAVIEAAYLSARTNTPERPENLFGIHNLLLPAGQ
jgi:predicted dehydrogenase